MQRIEAEGLGLPEPIADGLELLEPWMEFFMNAFYELSTERREAGLPIPWSAIKRYAENYDVAGPDFDVFLEVTRMMDRHCMRRAKTGDE